MSWLVGYMLLATVVFDLDTLCIHCLLFSSWVPFSPVSSRQMEGVAGWLLIALICVSRLLLLSPFVFWEVYHQSRVLETMLF